MRALLIILALGIGTTSYASAQEQQPASAEAQFAQVYNAMRQQDGQTVQACQLINTVANQLPSRARGALLGADLGGSYVSSDLTFWQGIGSRANIPVAATSVEQIKVEAESVDDPTQPGQILGQFQLMNVRCREVKAYLEPDMCPEPDPVGSVYVPVGLMPTFKTCREMTAMSSRFKPASWVENDPEQLAGFNAERTRDQHKLNWYDSLLGSQIAPQCPVDETSTVEGVALFVTYGADAFQPESDNVRDEYTKWSEASRVLQDNASFEQTVALSQMPYIQWQGECEQVETAFGYTPAE